MDGGAAGSAAAAMAEAERWLVIAGKLLEVSDFESCKKYAERAADSAPLLEGVDQLVATAGVLLSAESQINGHLDWYAVLQLKPPTSDAGHEMSTVRLAYRRLALLLHPSKNTYPGSEKAFQLVTDSWSVLSDPEKKRLYDEEVGVAAPMANGHAPERSAPARSPSPPPAPAAFWTVCPGCFHAHEYEEEYEDQRLLCPNCRRQFLASRLPNPPPIVPGTGLYYCSWGLVPLGYSDCPVFPRLNFPQGTLCVPALPQQQQQYPPQQPLKSTPISARKAPEHDKPRSGVVTRRSARLSGEEPTLTPPSDDTRAEKHPFSKMMDLAAAAGEGSPSNESGQQLGGGGSQIHTRSSALLNEEAATLTPPTDNNIRAQTHPFMNLAAAQGRGPPVGEPPQQLGGRGGSGSHQIHTRSSGRLSEDAANLTPPSDNNIRAQTHPFMNRGAAVGRGPPAGEQRQQLGGGGGSGSQIHTRSSARLNEEAATMTHPSDNNIRPQNHPFMKMMNLAAAARGGLPAREHMGGRGGGGGGGPQMHMGVQDSNLASFADFVGRFDMNTFGINLDANSQGLGNLANLPFAP